MWHDARKHQIEGAKSLQKVLNYLTRVLTSPNNPMDADQFREFTATLMYFPETREALASCNGGMRTSLTSPELFCWRRRLRLWNVSSPERMSELGTIGFIQFLDRLL
jgi:hypothetical protein